MKVYNVDEPMAYKALTTGQNIQVKVTYPTRIKVDFTADQPMAVYMRSPEGRNVFLAKDEGRFSVRFSAQQDVVLTVVSGKEAVLGYKPSAGMQLLKESANPGWVSTAPGAARSPELIQMQMLTQAVGQLLEERNEAAKAAARKAEPARPQNDESPPSPAEPTPEEGGNDGEDAT